MTEPPNRNYQTGLHPLFNQEVILKKNYLIWGNYSTHPQLSTKFLPIHINLQTLIKISPTTPTFCSFHVLTKFLPCLKISSTVVVCLPILSSSTFSVFIFYIFHILYHFLPISPFLLLSSPILRYRVDFALAKSLHKGGCYRKQRMCFFVLKDWIKICQMYIYPWS